MIDNRTKVTVSDRELALATDRDIILTKRAVIEKASALFSSLIPGINNTFGGISAADKILNVSVPKISKGENYKGFPYVIMDHPASFKKENIFAVRTMFLWGHFFSITLHLAGHYKTLFETSIYKKLQEENDFFIAAGEEEWEHHFAEDNFAAYTNISPARLLEIKERKFLKVALKYELHHWNMMKSLLPGGYKKISNLINIPGAHQLPIL